MASKGQAQSGCIFGCPVGQGETPECEVVFKGEGSNHENLYRKCKKNPDHPNFISCSEFKVEDLPSENRTRRMMDEVFHRSVQTVRIQVPFISNNRPDKFADSNVQYPYAGFKGSDRVVLYGTGKIIEVFYPQGVEGKPCPCPLCKESTHPKKFWWIRVRTATHVIYDRSEAERASFECFYDNIKDVEEKRVRTIYGFDTFNIVTAREKSYRSDVCDVICVTHDHDVASLLYRQLRPAGGFLYQPHVSDTYAPSKIIVSHPHGYFKRITLGSVLHLTAPTGQSYPVNTPLPFKTETVYRSSSRTKIPESFSQNEEKHRFPDSKENEETRFEGTKENEEIGFLTSNSIPSKSDGTKPQDAFITSEQYNMHEKLEVLKNQLQNINCSEQTEIGKRGQSATRENSLVTEQEILTDDYLAEFYLIFLREQVLMFLVICAVVRQKVINPDITNFKIQVEKAFKNFFDVYINKNLNMTFVNASANNLPDNPTTEGAVGGATTGDIDTSTFQNAHQQGKYSNTVQMASNNKTSFNDNDLLGNTTENHDRDESNTWLNYWHTLLKVSEKEYASFKSKVKDHSAPMLSEHSRSKSVILSMYIEIENIIDSIRAETKQNNVELNENVLPLVFDRLFESCSKTLEIFGNDYPCETDEKKTSDDCITMTQNEKMDKETKEYKGNEIQRQVSTISDDETTKEKQSLPHVAANNGNQDLSGNRNKNSDNIPDTKGVREIKVPAGSSFTLPPNAKYAFRVYSDTPGWISFPPGTSMTFPDGERVENIGEPLFEFKINAFVPEKSYVTYTTNTCPGSSGATVYCDNALGQNVTPFFPHSWHMAEGLNRSGVRDSVYSLYSKLILADANQIMQGLVTTNYEKTHKMPSLVEVSKAVAIVIRGILMKSLS